VGGSLAMLTTSNTLKLLKIPNMLLGTILFVISNLASAGTIECQKSGGNGTCIPADINTLTYRTGVDTTNSLTSQTTVWVSSVVDSVFNLVVPNNSIPRDVISYVRNTNPSLDINLNMSSDRFPYNSGNATIITSLVHDLKIISDGKNGTKGSDSSELCANAFANGSLGSVAKSYWNNGRTNASNPNKCEQGDMTYANNMFACPSGYTLNPNIPSDTIEITKVIQKRRCSTQVNQPICIGRTANIKCITNLVSNIKCDVTDKKWEDLGDFYNQPPQGSKCDTTKYLAGDISNSTDRSGRSGDITNIEARIFEKQFILASSNIENACKQELERHIPMKISWSVPFFDQEIGQNSYHPGNSLKIERPTSIKNELNNQFTIPLIDNINSINGDDLTPSNLRYYITGIDSAVNIDPRSVLKNCLGLNGSNPGRLQCERTTGPPFWIGIGLIDKYGNKSNTLRIQIPEGRFGYHYKMHIANVIIGNNGCDQNFCPYGQFFEFYSGSDHYYTRYAADSTWRFNHVDLTTGDLTYTDLTYRLDSNGLPGEYYPGGCISFSFSDVVDIVFNNKYQFFGTCSQYGDPVPIKYYY
jgi:hypothetical protein